MQGVTRAQAEEYVHKSEALLKEAGEFLKDAVKVVPPEGQEGSSTEFMFDGTDIAFMPPTVGSFGPSNRDFLFSNRKGKGRETAAQAQHRLAGTRAAAMLAQLKRDPDLLKADPAAQEGVREAYEEWLKAEVSSKEGGMDNSFWSQRIKTALGQADDGKVLEATLNALGISYNYSQTGLKTDSCILLCQYHLNWTHRRSGPDISSEFTRSRKMKRRGNDSSQVRFPFDKVYGLCSLH